MLKAKTLSTRQPVYALYLQNRGCGLSQKWSLEVCLPRDETIKIQINGEVDQKVAESLLRALGIIPSALGVAHGE